MERTTDDLRHLYSNLMGEIKARSDLIPNVLSMDSRLGIGPRCELCWLQLRMICELIALATVAGHGNIPATRKGGLHSTYQADKILKHLEKIHADFFPIPARQVKRADGQVIGYDPITTGILTKAELIKLYWKSADHLHRGTLEKMQLFSVAVSEPKEILSLNELVRATLRNHLLKLSQTNQFLWIEMESAVDGRARVHLMEPVLEQPHRGSRT